MRCAECDFPLDDEHDRRHATVIRLRRYQRERDQELDEWKIGER